MKQNFQADTQHFEYQISFLGSTSRKLRRENVKCTKYLMVSILHVFGPMT